MMHNGANYAAFRCNNIFIQTQIKSNIINYYKYNK